MQQIADWLNRLGMSEYAQRFADNRVDFSVLPDLTDADLKDLGVVLGDRRKILRAIARLDVTPEAAVLMTRPPSSLSDASVQGSAIAEETSEHRDVSLHGIAQATEGGNPRGNYHRLIAGAVKGLDRSTAEARREVYERARTALIAHLRLNQRGLLEGDIVKERLALEEAIREIEAEARKPRTEVPTTSQPATHPASTSNVDRSPKTSPQRDILEERLPVVLPDERSSSRQSSLEAVRGFRDVVSEVQGFAAIIGTAAQSRPYAREVHEEEVVDPQHY
jgi:SAM domain (Sterile alpha motif)